jgi:anaerobic ribonucleoside-triphosphate reductase activating protein
MNQDNDLLLDLNILSRSTQKYYDRQLQPYNLTYAQLPVLLMIYEHEGISLNAIVQQGQYDKGTVTKNVQKLESLGYVTTRSSLQDKRSKELYPTDKAKEIVSRIYRIRQSWWTKIIADIPQDQVAPFILQTQKMVASASHYAEQETLEMNFRRILPLSASRQPGALSMVLSVAGCNFRCPSCPDKSRIFIKESDRPISQNEVLKVLDARKGFLEGIVVTGGEPCMHPGLLSFLELVKQRNLRVCLETNGSFPDVLKEILNRKLVNLVRIDVKNCPSRYAASSGLKQSMADKVSQSLDLIKTAGVPWELQLTIDGRHHDLEALKQLMAWTGSPSRIALIFHESGADSVDASLPSADSEKRQAYVQLLKQYAPVYERKVEIC